MDALAVKPHLSQLNKFIARIDSYPITARQLLKLADSTGAPTEIHYFYEGFAPDMVFDDQEDLAAASEQVELMREQEADTPREEEKATEEF